MRKRSETSLQGGRRGLADLGLQSAVTGGGGGGAGGGAASARGPGAPHHRAANGSKTDRGGGADCGSLWVATVHTAVETWRRSGVAPALRRRFGRDDAAKRKSARAEMASRVREGAS